MAIIQPSDNELAQDAAERQYERQIYITEQAKKREQEYALAKLDAEKTVQIAKYQAGAGQGHRVLIRLFSLPVLLIVSLAVFVLTLCNKESEPLNRFLSS